MSSITIADDFTIQIPESVREEMSLKPGEKLQVIAYDNQIVLVRTVPIEQAAGMLKGHNLVYEREKIDRCDIEYGS